MIKRNFINSLLFTLFISVALLCHSSIAKAQPSFPSTELLTRTTNAYPAFSPDGEKIAYMSNAGGGFSIYGQLPIRESSAGESHGLSEVRMNQTSNP